MSTGWSLFVIVLIVANIIGCGWLLFANRNVQIDPDQKGHSTGHDFDGIEGTQQSSPRLVDLALHWDDCLLYRVFRALPGLRNFAGVLGWSSANEVEAAAARADAEYGPIFAGYLAQDIPSLLEEARAVRMGSRIFANRCSVCHGSDARGGPGYPNLTDNDWIYGGSPEKIVERSRTAETA